jgi:putative transport protein
MHSLVHFFVNSLRTYPEIALFLTLALGFWFGSLKFRSFSLGAVTSTLIAGLLVGLVIGLLVFRLRQWFNPPFS